MDHVGRWIGYVCAIAGAAVLGLVIGYARFDCDQSDPEVVDCELAIVPALNGAAIGIAVAIGLIALREWRWRRYSRQ